MTATYNPAEDAPMTAAPPPDPATCRRLAQEAQLHGTSLDAPAPKCTCGGVAGCEDWCACAPWAEATRIGEEWCAANLVAVATQLEAAAEMADRYERETQFRRDAMDIVAAERDAARTEVDARHALLVKARTEADQLRARVAELEELVYVANSRS